MCTIEPGTVQALFPECALCLFQVIRIIRTLLAFPKTPILSSRAVTVKERG